MYLYFCKYFVRHSLCSYLGPINLSTRHVDVLGTGYIDRFIFRFGIRWKRVFGFTPRMLCHRKNEDTYWIRKCLSIKTKWTKKKKPHSRSTIQQSILGINIELSLSFLSTVTIGIIKLTPFWTLVQWALICWPLGEGVQW